MDGPPAQRDLRSRGWAGRLRMTQWFWLATAIVGAATLVSIVVGVVAIVRLSDARDLVVDRLDPASVAALRLSNALINEETGVRGFVLTGREEFLAPYRQGRREERRAVAQLHRLGDDAGTPTLAADLLQVEKTARIWREDYTLPTIARVRRRGPEAVRPLSAERGRLRFTNVRAALAEQREGLAAERAAGREQLSDSARFLSGAFVAIAALLLLATLTVGVALRRAVARPLIELGRRIRRVARGDFEHPLRARGPRDILELADDVESMRRRIVDELALLEAANRRLDSQAHDLARSNAELEQFAYVASHDLQEPLRKVASFCQLLEQRYRGQLDERADQYIDFAVDGAKRMQQLINDLLAFSRVGRLGVEPEVVELDAVLEQALGNLAATIDESGATVEAENLPEVRGEPGLLAAVFQNLIGNAIKFRSEAPPAVRIDADRRDGEWLISVSDNGIGVDEEYAERVFVIFQRLHPKERYPGTGIGLAMCRKIVEHHGGRIWLDTETADVGGAAFRFTLPALEEDPAT